MNQVYATKSHMTQTFQEGKRIPLTVLRVSSHTVIDQKTEDKDGYSATVFGIGQKKKANKPQAQVLKNKGIEVVPQYLKEIKTDESAEIKSVLNLSEILIPGATINVASDSKGKGTSGVMKRWGFAGGPRTHGQSDRRRAPGSIGRGTTPGRVLPGKHMAGRMGNQRTNIRNLKIHSFNPETSELLITGAIPGGRGAIAMITVINAQSK